MRVGVALPALPEAGGGGYIFERDLFEAFLSRIAGSPHHFVLLGAEPSWSRPLPPNAVYAAQNVPAPSIAPRALRAAQQIPSKLRGKLGWTSGKTSAEANEARSRTRSEQQTIQFLVHFQPWPSSFDVPYLVFVWDLEHRRQPYFPEVSSDGEWQVREQHYAVALARASVVVTGTTAGRKQIEDFYRVPPDRVLVSPLPTPSDALILAATIDLPTRRIAGSTPTLFYPAQFWAHKNHIGLLEALRLLADRHGLRPTLLLAGSDQGNRAHVEQHAKDIGVAEQLNFLGFVPRDRLLELYTRVSALVYPSTFGPDNLPPLEAFALGCPVVASRLAGAEEQLGDAAVLFDPHDHLAMAEGIRSVLMDEAFRASLIAKGRERAQQRKSTDVADCILAWLNRFEAVRSLWP